MRCSEPLKVCRCCRCHHYRHNWPSLLPRYLSGQLEYALRPAGLMIRDVELEDNWFSDAYGPMLGYMKDTNAAVALMPGKVYGYWYKDPATGRKTRMTRKTLKF